MFKGKTAWFSKSCIEEAVHLWGENGGKFSDISVAEYIFSDDWEHEDTKSLIDSGEYLNQRLTVFRSSFVVHAVYDGLEKTYLGKFVLFHPDIDKALCARKTFDTNKKKSVYKKRNKKSSNIILGEKSNGKVLHVRNLPKVIGLLHSLIPGEDGVEVIVAVKPKSVS